MTIALTLQKYLVAGVVVTLAKTALFWFLLAIALICTIWAARAQQSSSAEAECYIKESPTTVNSELPSDSAFGALSQGCCSGSLDTLLARHR